MVSPNIGGEMLQSKPQGLLRVFLWFFRGLLRFSEIADDFRCFLMRLMRIFGFLMALKYLLFMEFSAFLKNAEAEFV